jgi:uncharacterized membrane protein YgcG
MERHSKKGVLAVCLVWATAAAQQKVPTGNVESEPEATMPVDVSGVPARVSSRAAENLLRKRVESVDWTDKPFEEVLEWLKENGEGRVNVVPKWGPLGVENVNRESLVTLQLNNTTVSDVLVEALEQLSEDGELRFRGIENKLTISTRQDFERKMYTKVYDMTDVMFRVPDFGRTAPQIDLQQASRGGGGGGRGGGGGGGGGGTGVFQGGGQQGQGQDEEGGQQGEQQIEQRMGRLRDLIQNSIAPETWDTTGNTGPGAGRSASGAGGGRGRIEVHGRSLVITNTIEVHEMIAGRFSFSG